MDAPGHLLAPGPTGVSVSRRGLVRDKYIPEMLLMRSVYSKASGKAPEIHPEDEPPSFWGQEGEETLNASVGA
jgi:hypothetical protein